MIKYNLCTFLMESPGDINGDMLTLTNIYEKHVLIVLTLRLMGVSIIVGK